MDEKQLLELVKNRLGISTIVRDSYISMIIKSVIKELEDEKGIVLEVDNANHTMFIVDYVTWRYDNVGENSGIPRHLQFRLNNLKIHNSK